MQNRISLLDTIVVGMVTAMLAFIAALCLALVSTPAHARTCAEGFEWHEPTQTCRVPCKQGEIRGEDGVCRQPLCEPQHIWYPELGYCVPIGPPNCQPRWPCDLEPGRAPAEVIKRKGLTCRAVRVDIEQACAKGDDCRITQQSSLALLLTVLVSCGK